MSNGDGGPARETCGCRFAGSGTGKIGPIDLVLSHDGVTVVYQLKDAIAGRWAPRNREQSAAIVRRTHETFLQRLRNQLVHRPGGRVYPWQALDAAHVDLLFDVALQLRTDRTAPAERPSCDSQQWPGYPWPEPPRARKGRRRDVPPAAEYSPQDFLHFFELLVVAAAAPSVRCLHTYSPTVTGEVVTAVHDAALQAVTDAIGVRDSIVRDDPSISREQVGRFAATYLGIQNPAGTEAVGHALLHLPLEPGDAGGDFRTERTGDLIGDLRRETKRQRRALRLIGTTQLFGRCVASLDEPAPRPEPGLSTLGDMRRCRRPRPDALPDLDGEFEDPRIGRVLAQLHPMERAVAIAYAYGGGITWAEAEVNAGAPAGYGERVRRKLLRLGAQQTARTAAAPLRRAA